MPSKIARLIGSASAAEVGKMLYQLFFPLMFMFGEKLSQVLPVPEDHGVMPPPLRNASLPSVATLYNKHTGGRGCSCVSIRAPKATWHQLYAYLVFCLSFLASPVALS
jgi:hypothetical protein